MTENEDKLAKQQGDWLREVENANVPADRTFKYTTETELSELKRLMAANEGVYRLNHVHADGPVENGKGRKQSIEPNLYTVSYKDTRAGKFSLLVAPGVMKKITDILKAVSDEFIAQLSDDGWNTRTVDPAHVSMVKVRYPKSEFDQFDIEADTDIFMTVSKMPKFNGGYLGILPGKVQYDERYTIESEINPYMKTMVVHRFWYHESVTFVQDSVAETRFMGDPRMIKIPRLPELDQNLPCVEFNVDDMLKFLERASGISDSCKITLWHTPPRLEFKSVYDNNVTKMELPHDKITVSGRFPNRNTPDPNDPEAKPPQYIAFDSVGCNYPLEYLLKFAKAIPKKTLVKLTFRDEYPLFMKFLVPLNKSDTGIEVTFLLAPRTE